MSTPQTTASTPRLSEVARHVVAPVGATSTGWPAVRDKCAAMGITFRPWQHGAGSLILCKRGDGKYAATIGGTGLSIPRQVGKTFLVGAIVFALCLLRPNLTVIWTAHRLRTAEETFGKMQKFAKRKAIAPHIERVIRGSGDEAIIFRNGSRILFGARERGFGRGFDEVDVLIFDEAQILSDAALDDMIPATNQSRQDTGALLLFMGTPPKPENPSEVFTRMRTEALSGADDDTGWVEFGADENYVPPLSTEPLTARDWAQVAKANPSFPDDTPREAILRMRKKLGAASYIREGLGIWDKPGSKALPNWPHILTEAAPDAPAMFGLGVSIDRSWSSIGAAGDVDGVLTLGGVKRAAGTAWVVEEAKRLTSTYNVPLAVDTKGPASDLVPALHEAGVPLVEAGSVDYLDACAGLFDAVAQGTVAQLGGADLNDAVDAAMKQPVGDRFRWGRKSGDVSMLEAVTLARWAAANNAASTFNIW